MGKKKEVFKYDETVTLAETLDEIRESAQRILFVEAKLAVLLKYAIEREEDEADETQKAADV
jgi:dsDNA-binding SOS-regulon protein